MEQKRKYFAFISYSHKDSEMAKWLQHEFEYYELPSTLFEVHKDLCKEDLPESFRPIFRDEDELAGGDLKPQISEALSDSEYLIVVCSPNSAQSSYVDSEIKEFISLSPENKRRIFPFIIDGKPHQDRKNEKDECFPKALLKLSNDKTEPIELIAGDVNATGRDHAFVKILAGTLKEKNVSFADLWDRYAVYKAEEERKQREQRDKLLIAQSRFLAEKANALVEEGDSYIARLLALEALPKDLENPDRPYTLEAEIAMRKACEKNNCVFKGHTGSVDSMTFSPNGKLLVSASSTDNSIRIWNIQTGACLHIIEKPSVVEGKFGLEVFDGLIDEIDYNGFNSVSFSQDSSYIVATGKDATIFVWKYPQKKCLKKLYNSDIRDCIYCAKFLPNNKYIISGGDYSNDDHEYVPSFSIWDIETGHRLVEKDTDGTVYDISISPNESYIATIGWNSIKVFDAKNFQLLYNLDFLSNDNYPIHGRRVSFSYNGKLLACSSENRIYIWETKTKKLIKTIESHNVNINSIAFSLNDMSIIGGCADNNVYEWDIQSGKCNATFEGHTGEVNTIATHSKVSSIASGGNDNFIRLWDSKKDKSIFSISIPYNYEKKIHIIPNIKDLNIIKDFRLSINRNGTINISKNHTNKIIKTVMWNDRRPWQEQERESLNVYTKDKKLKASYYSPLTSSIGCCNSIGIDNGKSEYLCSNPHLTEITSLLFSPDGDSIVSLSSDKDVHIIKNLHTLYDVENSNVKNSYNLLTLSGHTKTVRYASFSDNGRYIVTASDDMTIRIWDFQTGNCIQILLDSCTYGIKFADFTPDGKYIISTNYDNVIKIWEFPTLQELIDETRERFKERPLTPEERKKYYLD